MSKGILFVPVSSFLSGENKTCCIQLCKLNEFIHVSLKKDSWFLSKSLMCVFIYSHNWSKLEDKRYESMDFFSKVIKMHKKNQVKKNLAFFPHLVL